MQLTAAMPGRGVEWAIVLTFVTAAAIFAISTLAVGWQPLVGNLQELTFWSLALIVLLTSWQISCRFLRWYFLSRELGIPIKPLNASLFYTAGLGMTLTPGRIGETLRLWFINKKTGVPYRRLGALYVADRAGDAMAYTLMLSGSFVFHADKGLLRWTPLIIIFTAWTFLAWPRILLNALAVAFRVTGRFKNFVLWMRRALRNTSSLFRPQTFFPALLIGTAGWCAAPIILSIALSDMGSNLTFSYAAGIYAAGALTGGATMLPGGGGSTELVIVALLVAANVPFEIAVSATLIVRVAFLWLPVTLGLLFVPTAMARINRAAVA